VRLQLDPCFSDFGLGLGPIFESSGLLRKRGHVRYVAIFLSRDTGFNRFHDRVEIFPRRFAAARQRSFPFVNLRIGKRDAGLGKPDNYYQFTTMRRPLKRILRRTSLYRASNASAGMPPSVKRLSASSGCSRAKRRFKRQTAASGRMPGGGVGLCAGMIGSL